MMKIFTNKLIALTILSSFAFASCNNDSEDDPTPENACKITRVESSESDDDTDRSVTEVEYNAQGYVTKFTERGYDGSVLEDTEVTIFTYNSNNQLIKEEESDNDGSNEYTTYEYNSDGTVKKRSFYYNNTLEGSEDYTYDSNKRLVRETEVYSGTTYTTNYQYIGSTGNISQETYSYNGVVRETVTYSNYDDKPNPYSSVKGLVVIGQSTNNPKQITYTSTYNSTNESYVYNFTYQYDAKGNVTKLTEVDAEDGDEYVQNFTYNCD